MLSAADALASWGARPLTVPTVTMAIVGWNAGYRFVKRVVSWANRPLASWSMPSQASFKVVTLTLPGFTENLSTPLHSPCSRVRVFYAKHLNQFASHI